MTGLSQAKRDEACKLILQELALGAYNHLPEHRIQAAIALLPEDSGDDSVKRQKATIKVCDDALDRYTAIVLVEHAMYNAASDAESALSEQRAGA